VSVYVAYRSKRTDEKTVEEVMEKLQKNNIEFSQLVDWAANHCLHAESSTEEGCSS
jgi:transcriptional regulator of NAD metabolism